MEFSIADGFHPKSFMLPYILWSPCRDCLYSSLNLVNEQQVLSVCWQHMVWLGGFSSWADVIGLMVLVSNFKFQISNLMWIPAGRCSNWAYLKSNWARRFSILIIYGQQHIGLSRISFLGLVGLLV